MKMRCVESKPIEERYGYTITREIDRKEDPDTSEVYGARYVFYCVVDDELILDSFKTIKEARKFIEKLL